MTTAIQLDTIPSERLLIPIVGTASLIVHAWSAKAKKQMLDTQQGRKTPKQHRDPQAEYEDCLYTLPDGYGFPTLAFKAATVGAARFFGKDVKMTELRQFIFVKGEMGTNGIDLLTRLEGEPKAREDMVRIGTGTDLRYRAEFREWKAQLDVTYVTSSLSQTSLLTLIDAGGMGVGVGDWRPERKGQNGTYKIDDERDVTVIK